MMTTEKTGSKRMLIILALTVVLIAVAVGIGIAVATVGSEKTGPEAGSTNAGSSDSGSVSDPTLTLAAARAVFDGHEQAKESGDAEAFEQSTCRAFIDADMSLRGQKSVQDLLSAYSRARRFVPVQFLDDQTVVGASSTGVEGKIEVSAKVTDNRFVPPTTEQRVITWDMSYENGVWKFCPTTDPV